MPRRKKTATPVVDPTPVSEPEVIKTASDEEVAGDGPPTTSRAHLVKEAERILNGLGITPAEMAREASDELMTPKMALIGCLQTVQKLCEVATINIMNSVGPLNVHNLGALLGGIRGTLTLGEKTIMTYAQMQAALRARELMDQIQKKLRESEEIEATPTESFGSETEPTDEELQHLDHEDKDVADPAWTKAYTAARGKKGNLLN